MMPIDEADSSTFTFTIGFSSYDVFLNFRGEDTRNNFAGILNLFMKDKGINVFMDSEKLWTGEAIGPACLRAIDASKISVPVFSPSYADSKWCLLELSQILHCHQTNGQLVLPIFFDVEPSHVRNQIGSFGKAFREHEKNFESHIIKTWRKALKVIGSLKGEVINKSKDQAKLVESIVKRVLDELASSAHLDECKYAVGIDHRVSDLLSLLNIDSNDVQLIGICGSQGIGKTTIAEAMYNHVLSKFNRHSFISDVSRQAMQCMGLASLQKRLLRDILKVDIDINHYHRGKRLIKRMLCKETILLVLDDVDSKEQVAALVGELNWFGPRSRVIITTRYEHILKVAKVDEDKIYWPPELDNEESLELFSLHAFSMKEPLEDYMKLSHDVICYSGGLPLSLEVLGSHLSGIRNKKEWKSTLRKLRSGKLSISNLASLRRERRNNSLRLRPLRRGNMGNSKTVVKASKVFRGSLLDPNASATHSRVGNKRFKPVEIFQVAICKFAKGYLSSFGSKVIDRAGKRFSISEIRAATDNFNNSSIIGRGGTGKVYRGRFHDDTLGAVKRMKLDTKYGQAAFENEMFVCENMENGGLSNENLVSIIGFCEEENELIIVYEYMRNGSLRNHLCESGYPLLTWKQRLAICIDVARGLHCLHSLPERGIIHRDVKIGNILLCGDSAAKLADFGLSRRGPALDATHVRTTVRGTNGYIAPEYLMHGYLSFGSDVFSFGVVLLEVVCGRRAYFLDLSHEKIVPKTWALKCKRQRSLETIVDPRLEGNYSPESLKRFSDIVWKCLEDINWRNRPTMGEVLKDLEYVLQLHEAWLRNGGEEYSTHSSLINGGRIENSRIRIESPLVGNEDSTCTGQEYSTNFKLVGSVGSENLRTGVGPGWARFDDSSVEENSNYISFVGAIGSQNSRTEIDDSGGEEYSSYFSLVGSTESKNSRIRTEQALDRNDDSSGKENSNYISLIDVIGSENSRTRIESALVRNDDSSGEEYFSYFSAGCNDFSELVSPVDGFEERTFASRWI